MSIIAIKGNREEKILEDQKKSFLAAGYDVIEDGVRTVSPSKTVSYPEYSKVKEELLTAKSYVEKLTETNTALEVENKALKADNDKLTKELEKLNKK